MAQVEMDAVKMAHQVIVDVKVKRLREWKMRIRIGLFFVRLGIWIMGCNCQIEMMGD